MSGLAPADRTATCLVPAGAMLGECPIWSAVDARLYWVDIDGRAVHRTDPATGADERLDAPGRPTAVALTKDPGHLLVAIDTRLAFLDWAAARWEDWNDLEPDDVGNRLNDGRCDTAGRFWVGSMFDPSAAGRSTGMLHRVDPDGTAVTMRTGVGVSNGLAFSPDGRTMYWADTPREVVWAYDYDIDTGIPSNERVFIDFGPLPGRPDGACVDEEGGYWIACVRGGAVLRVMPDGTIERRVTVPVSKPTMPALGGPDRSTLFITTIGGGGSHVPDPSQPDAGGLFAVETDSRGLLETPFAGRPPAWAAS